MLLGVDRLVDEVISVSRLKQVELPLFDLVHRPFQVVTANDLNLLQSVARRFIVSHLDCISYANPSYALSETEWTRYRRQTQYVFAAADGIAFISKDAAQDAAHQGLHVPEERMCITYVGVNHHLHRAVEALPPPRSDSLMDEPYLLVIGTNFKHKNRVYAIRLLRVLIEKYGWSGRLVLAGPNVASGGSNAEEALERSRSPDLQHRIEYIGWISEGEKKWLLQHAAVVLYPTIYEGFGIIPFEAAAAGTPALRFRSTSLTEVLGEDVVYLETLNPEMVPKRFGAYQPECAWRQVETILLGRKCSPGRRCRQTWEFIGMCCRCHLPRGCETLLAVLSRAWNSSLGQATRDQSADNVGFRILGAMDGAMQKRSGSIYGVGRSSE
jgi:glycosyltransferase involved in cell wall biosynthesis